MTRLILTWYFCVNICLKKQAKHLLLFMLALRLSKYVRITVLRVSDNTVVRVARFPYVDGQTSDPYTSKTLKVIQMRFICYM